jgi:UDP-N-acetylmuramate--alanine ligase
MAERRDTASVALPPPGARIHFVGAGGAGMIGLARVMLAQGYRVSGSDRADSPALAALRAAGAEMHVGHDAAFLGDAALVVRTAAAPETNVEVSAALARGVPVVKRAALLGLLANARRLIAVAGTHGKSTTSGMVAFILSTLGRDPLFVIGAEVRDLGTSARDGAGDLAVVEADEYDYSFLHLTPDVSVVTNIEHDHPDIFPDMAAYRDAFARYVARTRPGGTVIVPADDPECAAAAAAAPLSVGQQTVGTTPDATWRMEIGADGTLTLTHTGERIGPATLMVAGEHNARNAAMAVAACAAVGVPRGAALETVARYRGVGRRFEVMGEAAGVTVVDDYAHHPTEVRATLAAARSRYPGRRIVAVFQPHTYSRAALYAAAFGAALAAADVALVTDIYAAREADPGTVGALDIVKHIPQDGAVASGDLDATLLGLGARVRPGDVVLTLGAGDVTTVGPRLLATLRERAAKG